MSRRATFEEPPKIAHLKGLKRSLVSAIAKWYLTALSSIFLMSFRTQATV